MQDRYVADLRDYLKFACIPRLAVVWYRTATETHNADGKYLAYLDLDGQAECSFGRNNRDHAQTKIAAQIRATARQPLSGMATERDTRCVGFRTWVCC